MSACASLAIKAPTARSLLSASESLTLRGTAATTGLWTSMARAARRWVVFAAPFGIRLVVHAAACAEAMRAQGSLTTVTRRSEFSKRCKLGLQNHTLLLQDAVLDGAARCCNSGKRDACGVCDGGAKAVDVQGVCCASGVLDAGGYCCESGGLDECGVCDGDSQSCSLSAAITVQVRDMLR